MVFGVGVLKGSLFQLLSDSCACPAIALRAKAGGSAMRKKELDSGVRRNDVSGSRG